MDTTTPTAIAARLASILEEIEALRESYPARPSRLGPPAPGDDRPYPGTETGATWQDHHDAMRREIEAAAVKIRDAALIIAGAHDRAAAYCGVES
jgi:hypothetical protein